MEHISTAMMDALQHGAAVIVQSRLVRNRCEITGAWSRQFARRFLVTQPLLATRLIRGANDLPGVSENRARQVWAFLTE